MKGIDIYSGNDVTSFQVIKDSGVEVCYIKATEGLTYNDSTLKSYYTQAKAVGLKIGFYHFLRNNNPIQEAKHFLSAVKGLEADCLYMIDVEVTLGQTVSQISSNVRQFADYLKSQGKDVGIYTYSSFYKKNLNDTVKDLLLWIAEYGMNSPSVDGYVGFQYSEIGSVSGVGGNVDLNVFTDKILIDQPITPKNDTLKAQIQALQYNLNQDYNAKVIADGLIRETQLYPNLQAVGKLIVKGYKSHVVQWIQQKLVSWNYLKKESYTDMVYDEATFQAITELQKKWDRETSGIIGVTNRTWEIFLNN